MQHLTNLGLTQLNGYHFLNLVANVERLFRAVLPDIRAAEFGPRRKLLVYLAQKIRNLAPEVETPDLGEQVRTLLDESIKAQAYVIHESPAPYDLSKIDFEALKQQFEQGRKRSEAEKLRGRINAKLQRMIRHNRSRMDYQREFQRMIDAYNEGALSIEVFFDQLVDLARRLNQEEQRHMRENLSQQELAIFDILTRPDMRLTREEKRQVKQVARELLNTLVAEKLVLDWRKRQKYRAAVRLTIETLLYDRLPERYSAELCDQKRDDVYRHVYDNYYGAGQSIYATAA
jgi:type I restriction enzyme R subunit